MRTRPGVPAPYVPRVRGLQAAALQVGPQVRLAARDLVGDDTAGEASEIAAQRELEEETGYHAAHWRTVGEFYSSPGMVSESFTLLVATGLTKVSEGGGVDGEDIMVHRVPLNGVADFIAAKRGEGCGIDVRVAMLLAGGLLAG